MNFQAIRFEVRNRVAHVVLNCPESANTINRETALELMHAAILCDVDP